jgi:O-antigen/teichoic acid export membrane protein
MFRAITNTVFTRLFFAIVNFIVVIGTARFLGAEIRGVLSLIGVGTSVLHVFNNLVGGTSLVYFGSRKNKRELLYVSYAWCILSSVVGTVLLAVFKIIPEEHIWDVFFLGLLLCFGSINQQLLLADKKILGYNISSFLQALLLVLVFLLMIFIQSEKSIQSFLIALYVSYSVCLLATILAGLDLPKSTGKINFSELFKELAKHGFVIQLASLLQLINYRFSFYLLEKHFGSKSLGIFSITIALSEALWILSRSMSTVQYSYISNTEEKNEHVRITIIFTKVVFLVTLLAVSASMIIPDSIYTLVLGRDFIGIKFLIFLMIPGILFHSITSILAHYFSGQANFRINTIASGIAAIVSIVSYSFFIPCLGIKGACIASNIVYFTSFIYSIFKFHELSSVPFKMWLPGKHDKKELNKLFQLLHIKKKV